MERQNHIKKSSLEANFVIYFCRHWEKGTIDYWILQLYQFQYICKFSSFPILIFLFSISCFWFEWLINVLATLNKLSVYMIKVLAMLSEVCFVPPCDHSDKDHQHLSEFTRIYLLLSIPFLLLTT